MSFRDALSALISPASEPASTDKRNEIANPLLASKRFILVLAFVALLYAAHEVFNPDTLKIIRDVVIAYLLCETLTKVATIAGNAFIKSHEVRVCSTETNPDEE